LEFCLHAVIHFFVMGFKQLCTSLGKFEFKQVPLGS
jgi:hypothetical protein